MTIKTTIAAALLAIAPTLSFAACFDDHKQQAMNCAEGKIWDENTSSCVDATT